MSDLTAIGQSDEEFGERQYNPNPDFSDASKTVTFDLEKNLYLEDNNSSEKEDFFREDKKWGLAMMFWAFFMCFCGIPIDQEDLLFTKTDSNVDRYNYSKQTVFRKLFVIMLGLTIANILFFMVVQNELRFTVYGFVISFILYWAFEYSRMAIISSEISDLFLHMNRPGQNKSLSWLEATDTRINYAFRIHVVTYEIEGIVFAVWLLSQTLGGNIVLIFGLVVMSLYLFFGLPVFAPLGSKILVFSILLSGVLFWFGPHMLSLLFLVALDLLWLASLWVHMYWDMFASCSGYGVAALGFKFLQIVPLAFFHYRTVLYATETTTTTTIL
ncbi:MAG: hypothetical protein ACTSUE_00265 [Promethearchaeota archaeon]